MTAARGILQHALALVALWACGWLLLQLMAVPLAEGLVLLTAGYLARVVPLVARTLTGAAVLVAGAWWLGAGPEQRAAVVEALTVRRAPAEAPHDALPDLEVEALAGVAP